MNGIRILEAQYERQRAVVQWQVAGLARSKHRRQGLSLRRRAASLLRHSLPRAEFGLNSKKFSLAEYREISIQETAVEVTRIGQTQEIRHIRQFGHSYAKVLSDTSDRSDSFVRSYVKVLADGAGGTVLHQLNVSR